MIRQTISHYRILSKLGGDAKGVVYKADDIRLHCFGALKLLLEAGKGPLPLRGRPSW